MHGQIASSVSLGSKDGRLNLAVFHFQGIYTLYSFINARIVTISLGDVKVLLTEENPFVYKLGNEVQSQVKEMGEYWLLLWADIS